MQDMKVLNRVLFTIFVLIIVVLSALLLEIPDSKNTDEYVITQWEIKWVNKLEPNLSTEQIESMGEWVKVQGSNSVTERSQGDAAQWVKFELPEINGEAAAILFEKVFGTRVVVKVDGNNIYNQYSHRIRYNTVLVPLTTNNSHQTIYVGLERNDSNIGIVNQIKIGKYQDIIKGFIRSNTTTYVLGSTFIFIALIMMVCSLFLYTGNSSMWISLCVIILSSGFLVLTYTPFSDWLNESMSALYSGLFDVSLFILLPTFTLFFEKTFGPGLHSIVRRFRIFQTMYSGLCGFVLVLYIIFGFNNQYESGIYHFISLRMLGIIMIIQFILLICISTMYAVRGDRNAIIFSAGFIVFALFGIGELLYFYIIDPYYSLFLWKWGLVCFLSSLIIILARKFNENHQRIIEYSKQLEMFNNELQRSERMEIISELAASVAHEVRNPLQVTRGFIQLLVERQPSEKVYLNMALNELDRASDIITDYLTFAKPEAGLITYLNILDEFIHIEGILIPMANMQGGKISVHIPNDIYIKGNSSKFKQAFINIIKNSIESLQGEGEIQIWAYEESEKVHIHIKDDGEGMDAEVLARLGEPYFTNKTKGTGLGLMVTLRIIEMMEGNIKYASEKGKGTEVIIQFPKVYIITSE
ncbi:Sporulation kinase A [compost metagenome]